MGGSSGLSGRATDGKAVASALGAHARGRLDAGGQASS